MNFMLELDLNDIGVVAGYAYAIDVTDDPQAFAEQVFELYARQCEKQNLKTAPLPKLEFPGTSDVEEIHRCLNEIGFRIGYPDFAILQPLCEQSGKPEGYYVKGNPLEKMAKRLTQELRDSGLTVIESTAVSDGEEMTVTFPPNSRNPNRGSKRNTSTEPKSTSMQSDPMRLAREIAEEAVMAPPRKAKASTESTTPGEDKKLSIYESNKLIEHIIEKTDLARNYIPSLGDDEAKIFQEVVTGNLDEEKKRYLCESGFLDDAYDEIKNNSIVVKEILVDTGNDAGPFPTGVREYKGIYWIYSMERDDEGFFLSLADAEDACLEYYDVVV